MPVESNVAVPHDDEFAALMGQIRSNLIAFFAKRRYWHAEDMASETLTRLMKQLQGRGHGTLASPTEIKAYAYGIAKKVLLEGWKEDAREYPLREDEERVEFTLPPLGLDVMNDDCRKLLRSMLPSILEQMSAEERQIVTMRLLTHEIPVDFEEIARTLGISPEAARQRFRRAREEFCRLLKTLSNFAELMKCFGLAGTGA